MICRISSGQVASLSKYDEAIGWLGEVAAYMNQNDPTTNARFMHTICGQDLKLLLICYADSLAAWERQMVALDEDPQWRKLMFRRDELFVPGSIYQDLYWVAQ